MHKQFRGSRYLNIGSKSIKLDYYLVEDKQIISGSPKPRNVYGIEIIKDDDQKEIIKDISINEERIINMIEIIKNNDVFPVHLHDVVEELL